MTRPRRYAKFEKMTLMLTEANAAFLRTWAESQGITINEFVRRILWDVEQKYSRLPESREPASRK
jgi:hypothetical protein